MQAEESIEINHGLAWNVDAGPHGVILRLGVGNNNIQPVGRATLEDHDQALAACARFSRAPRGASQKTWHCGRSDDGECAVTKKNASSDRHKKNSWLLAFSSWLEPLGSNRT